MNVKNRILEVKTVKASDLDPNAGNWRMHPHAQKVALKDVVEQVGLIDVLLAYKSPRNGGALTLIDGHLRHSLDPDIEWPVAILDVTDEEADLILATHDPITGMANTDGELLKSLLENVSMEGTGGVDLLQSLARLADSALLDEEGKPEKVKEPNVVPEMELQAYEHYDYIMAICRDTFTFIRAKQLLGLTQKSYTLKNGHSKKIGLCRVLDMAKFLDIIEDGHKYRNLLQSGAIKPYKGDIELPKIEE